MPGAEVSYNIAGVDDSFKITTERGYVQGYLRNADFPNEESKPNKGEIFWIEANVKGKGYGTQMMLDALRLIKSNGSDLVNLSPVSKSGAGLNVAMAREGYIALIRTSASGKSEYTINDKVFDQPED